MQRSALGGFTAALLVLSSLTAAQQPLLRTVDPVPPAARELDARQRGEDHSILETRFVRVDVGALRAAVGSELVLDLFGAPQTIAVERAVRGVDHDLFYGRVAGDPHALAVFAVLDGGATAAAIESADRVFLLGYTGEGDVHVLRRLDRARIGNGRECGVDHTHEVREAPRGDEDRQGPSDATRTVIDVACFYTPAARQSGGGTSAIQAELALRIGVANQTCVDSGVDHEYRLVWVAETNYTELGNSTDLGNFRGTSDGFMDEVHAARDDYGADLMSLIINNASFCGVGYLMTTVSTGFAPNAFSATVRSCLAGHTMTHEMGHTMGCHHDRANAGGQGAYPYSYGWRTTDNAFRTVMSYAPGTRVPRWSSPNVVYNSYTMGTANDDNARSLNNVKTVVSQFRSTKVLYWCPLPGGVAGSGGKPTIAGSGNVNTVRPIQITVGNTRVGANGALMLGKTRIDFPFFGAIVVPNPELSLPMTGSAAPIVRDVSAIRRLGAGAEMFFQAFFIDPTAPQGLSASDALQTRLP
jgi:hypothetical protein